MTKRTLAFLSALAAASVAATQATAALIAPDADTYLRDATPRGTLSLMDIRGGNIDFRGYVRFDLSELNIDQISDATLTFNVVPGASRNDTPTTGRFALQGLDNVATNTPQDWDEATLVPDTAGSEWNSTTQSLQNVTDLDGDVAGIAEDLSGAASGAGTFTITGVPLVDFLNTRVDDSGLATFIITNEDATDRGYGLASRENATETLRPVLDITYTQVPEPGSLGLAAVGAIALRRRRRAR